MRSLLTVFRKYFFQAFSIGAILAFLLSNILQPDLWSLQTASASVGKLGISLDENPSFNTSLTAILYNDAGSSFPGGSLDTKLGVFHCKTSGTAACAPNLVRSDEFISEAGGSRNIDFPAPGNSKTDTISVPDVSPRCGRVQVDIGYEGDKLDGQRGILGGKVFDLGSNCSGSQPPQTVTTCKGEKTLDQLRRELELAGYPGPWDTDSMVAAYNRAACPATTPAPEPTCSYSSTQARWQKDSNDPWGESKTINVGQSARVGGFHDGTGQLAGDVTLAVTGPDTNTTLGNGGTFAPPKAGNYQLKVTTNNQSGSNCEGAASLIVNVVNDTPACPYSSTQARLQKNTSDSWDNSKTINMGEQIRVGGFHDGTGQLANDVNLNVTGVASLANIGNGNFIQPNLAGSYTLTVTTTDGSGAACTDTATFQVNEAACVPDDSTCSASAPACGTTTTGEDNCGNTCTKQGEACAPGCTPDSNSCSAVMPSACGQVNTGKDNCGNACFKQSAACQPQGGITVTNTNNNTNNNSNTNNITFGNVGVGTNTQVLGVTQLPKTGLPAIAWLVSALIPTGFGLRRFRGIKKELEDDPNYIWEDRKFKSS